jgi:flagellar motility protein MotE (MotC chaperone)
MNTPTAVPPNPKPSPSRPGFRLLPVLALALGLVLTIRVGDMWQGLSVGVGTETQAQTDPAATNAAAPPPAEATPGTQSAATEPPPPEGTAAEGAPAEGEAATAQEAPPADPLDFTDEEVEVLQQLAKRREELDLRARQLDEREAMVAAAEQRMEQKMAELRALQTTVEDLLVKRSEAEEAKLQTLVQTYEKMKPKDAAQVFEEMDMDLLRDLVSRMKTSRAAPILALVSPTKVKELTLELAEESALPFAP